MRECHASRKSLLWYSGVLSTIVAWSKPMLWLYLFACCASIESFSSSSSGSSLGGRRPHDITSKQGLTALYNSGVASVERVKRPKEGWGGFFGIKHSGVVVSTNSGDRWLVHKGKGYGDSSQTVVTNAKHMSGAWKSGSSQPVQPGTKVADYVKDGGQNYNVLSDNCHDASKRMMNVGKGKR